MHNYKLYCHRKWFGRTVVGNRREYWEKWTRTDEIRIGQEVEWVHWNSRPFGKHIIRFFEFSWLCNNFREQRIDWKPGQDQKNNFRNSILVRISKVNWKRYKHTKRILQTSSWWRCHAIFLSYFFKCNGAHVLVFFRIIYCILLESYI